MIRKFIPKKTDIALVSSDEIEYIIHTFNHRPRKILAYKTPYEVSCNKSVALSG